MFTRCSAPARVDVVESSKNPIAPALNRFDEQDAAVGVPAPLDAYQLGLPRRHEKFVSIARAVAPQPPN